jgi:hypothetical protein
MTAVEFGSTLWANCQESCTAFQEHMRKTFESGKPLFGYECCQKFATEAFVVHLWIMSRILSRDTSAIDVLHDHFLRVMAKALKSQEGLDNENEFKAVQALLRKRYGQYYAAEAEDHRNHNQGVKSTELAEAVLTSLLASNSQPTQFLQDTVQIYLFKQMAAVREFRAKVTIED